MASCRRSQSYLVFFLTNKEHEQEEVIEGEKQRGTSELKTETETWVDEEGWETGNCFLCTGGETGVRIFLHYDTFSLALVGLAFFVVPVTSFSTTPTKRCSDWVWKDTVPLGSFLMRTAWFL